MCSFAPFDLGMRFVFLPCETKLIPCWGTGALLVPACIGRLAFGCSRVIWANVVSAVLSYSEGRGNDDGVGGDDDMDDVDVCEKEREDGGLSEECHPFMTKHSVFNTHKVGHGCAWEVRAGPGPSSFECT